MRRAAKTWRVGAASGLLVAALTASAGSPAPADLALGEGVTWSAQAGRAAVPAHLAAHLKARSAGEKGAGAGIVDLYVSLEIEIGSREIVERRVRVIEFLDEESLQAEGDRSAVFSADADTLSIDYALVVSPDGAVQTVDPSTVQVLPYDTDRVFSDLRRATIPLAGLEPGAVAIYGTTRTIRRDRMHTAWGHIGFPRLFHPRRRLEVQVSWAEPALEPVWRTDFDGFDCGPVGPLAVACHAVDVAAYPDDPDIVYRDVLPQLAIAERRSWREIDERFAGFVASAITGDEAVREHADSLVAGRESQREKLEAIHQFVAREVRYVGLGHGAHAVVPHPTGLTLQRRYGDCKDKTALLLEMLASQHIDAVPALVATGRRDAAKILVPTARYFDHLAACGELDDGTPYCADATDAYSGLSSVSYAIQGAVHLPLGVGAERVYELPEDRHRWRMHERLDMRLAADGSLVEHAERRYEGPYAASLRSSLAGLGAEEREKWALDWYHETMSDDVDPEFELSGVKTLADDLVIRSTAHYEPLVDPEADLVYTEQLVWLNELVGNFPSGNEHHDYEFQGFSYEGVVSFEIDPRWTLTSHGAVLDFESEYGTLKREFERDGATLIVRTSAHLPRRRVARERIEAFNRFLEIIVGHDEIRLRGTLEETGPAPALEAGRDPSSGQESAPEPGSEPERRRARGTGTPIKAGE